jgi:hypothetical protein
MSDRKRQVTKHCAQVGCGHNGNDTNVDNASKYKMIHIIASSPEHQALNVSKGMAGSTRTKATIRQSISR